jgi:cell division protein FtsZ
MVIAFVTTPFEFEGRQRMRNALVGLDEIRELANCLVVIPNDKLYNMITEDTSFVDAFKKVDLLLLEAVSSLTRLILDPGMINLDFADVRSVMSIGGQALLTFGEGMGVHRALNAVDAALSNVLIDSKKLRGARGMLLNVLGGPDLTLHEVTRCIQKLRTIVREDANIIFGANIDPQMNDKVMVSIIATGIEESLDDSMRMTLNAPHSENRPKSMLDAVNRLPAGSDGSAMFDAASAGDEEDLDIPTYIRRNKRFLGAPFREVE